MNIELLDNKRVLIDLCTEDMNILSLKPHPYNLCSNINKNILKSLIRIAQKKIGLSTDDIEQVYIETMPYNGGCFILITVNKHPVLEKYKVLYKPYKAMFLFSNSENMLGAIEQLYRIFENNYFSTLIVYNQKYYLLIYTKENLSTANTVILNEYCCNYTCCRDSINYIKEQGKIICPKNAVKKIGSAL